ncbi:V-type ATPase subunit [Candidatus Peribacteria bacterium]|nr:V-type ATPase subunit [Candidatus Peribacteria bacterium]
MSDFYFLSGQIRALEGKMFSRQQLDRMIAASTPEKAFGVLTELQYAQFIDADLKATDFDQVLEQGLQETKRFIEEGATGRHSIAFFWLQYDLNNLKRALKEVLVEGNPALPVLQSQTQEGYLFFGSYTPAELLEIITTGDEEQKLPKPWHAVVRRALRGGYESFYDAELALEQAYFALLQQLAKRSGDATLREVYALLVTSYQLRVTARSVLLRHRAPEGREILPTKDRSLYLQCETPQQLQLLLERAGYADALESWAMLSPYEQAQQLDRATDARYMQTLHEADQGAIGGAIIPLWYFEKRLRNSRLIRAIMLAKFQGMASEDIYTLLDTVS